MEITLQQLTADLRNTYSDMMTQSQVGNAVGIRNREMQKAFCIGLQGFQIGSRIKYRTCDVAEKIYANRIC